MPERREPSNLTSYLRTPETIELYLRGAMQEGDPEYVEAARRNAALAIARWNIPAARKLRTLLRVGVASGAPPRRPGARRGPSRPLRRSGPTLLKPD